MIKKVALLVTGAAVATLTATATMAASPPKRHNIYPQRRRLPLWAPVSLRTAPVSLRMAVG